MRVIIAGTRDCTSMASVVAAVQASGFTVAEVVSGGARGVDKLGEAWALEHGVPTRLFPANWHLYPRTAGRLRNVQMAEYADALIAVWNGRSPGTKHMVETMLARGKPTFTYRVTL